MQIKGGELKACGRRPRGQRICICMRCPVGSGQWAQAVEWEWSGSGQWAVATGLWPVGSGGEAKRHRGQEAQRHRGTEAQRPRGGGVEAKRPRGQEG